MLRVCYADDEEEEWPIFFEASQQTRKAARPRQQLANFVFRRLRAQPFWEVSDAGEDIMRLCSSLEAAFNAIAAEATALLTPLLDGGGSDSDDCPTAHWEAQGEGIHQGVWLRCQLWSGGVRRRNFECVPTLAALLDASPALMRDPPGRCYLSLMLAAGDATGSGTRVAAHAGPSNHRLRLHLPILLPKQPASPSAGEPAAPYLGIVVGEQRRRWRRGRCLLFDDSFTHHVDLSTCAPPTSAATPPAAPAAAAAAAAGGDGGSDGGGAALDAARLLLVVDCWHPDAEWLCPKVQRKGCDGTYVV